MTGRHFTPDPTNYVPHPLDAHDATAPIDPFWFPAAHACEDCGAPAWRMCAEDCGDARLLKRNPRLDDWDLLSPEEQERRA